MKWMRKDVAVAAARIFGYSGLSWAYYKCYEGKTSMRPDNWYLVPRELNLVNEVDGPWPMVDKLQAYVNEMKQKKKNDDGVFHLKPKDPELMEYI